jgi:uncharacterized protein (TIGR03067 family)
MNEVTLGHPNLEQLTAFAQGRLSDVELADLATHLGDCSACRTLVEATSDDTLISLLRAADTTREREQTAKAHEAVTVAPAAPASVTLATELADHGRYRVQELLGVGGMGSVYKAEHLLMERPVALKLISHSLMSNPSMIERFRREVKTAAKLKHPNIVMAYDAEQAGNSHFLVMEYVEGKSLARLVSEQGPLPVRQACDYIRQAALGLQHAHERGMVHRDIKPQNLMLTTEGQVKILDFGLARFAMEAAPTGALLAAPGTETPTPSGSSTGSESLTQVGTVMGTPDYIAPEQATDAHKADIRADIYSLGCTLYDLLAGHAPFPEGTVVAKVKSHMERSPRPLAELRKDVPQELARVVERMMAKDPARRYQTPGEVAAALAPFTATASGKRRRWPLAVAAALLLGLVGIYFAPIVYRIVTDQGILIVEVDDPQVEVVLATAALEVRDRARNQTYMVSTGGNDLKAGDYQFEVKDAGGLVVFTKEFRITRNDRTAVRIALEGAQLRASLTGASLFWAREADRKGSGIPFDFVAREGHTAMRLRSLTLVFQGISDSKVPGAHGGLAIPVPGMAMKGSNTYDGFPVEQRVANSVNTVTAGSCRMTVRDRGTTLEIDGQNFDIYGQPQTIRIRLDGTLAQDGHLATDRTTDQQRIQGTWRGIAGMAMGQRLNDQHVSQVVVKFSGNRMEIPPSPGNKGGNGTFVLDPTKSPKRIQATADAAENFAKMHGVYGFLDDNTLRLCMSAPEHGPITEFGGKVGLDITLRREVKGIDVNERSVMPPHDEDMIQGTWKGVAGSVQGQQMPEIAFHLIGPTITFSGDKVTWKTNPIAEVKDAFGGVLAKFSLDGVYHLDSTKSPKTINLTVLGHNARTPLGTPAPRALLGIYKLEGDSLEVCIAIDPEHAEERPGRFESVPGKFIVHVKLKRGTAGVAGPPGRLINAFGTGFLPITRDLVEDSGGWKITTDTPRVVRLYEVQPPLEDCLVTYRAKIMCSRLDGKAYLEMWCRMPYGGEFFSKDPQNPVTGTTDWKTVQVPFYLQKNERPDLLKLNVRIEGAGTVWIKDIELLQAPLPADYQRPSNIKAAAGFTPGVIKAFGASSQPLSADRMKKEGPGWRIDVAKSGTVPLFETKDFTYGDPLASACLATYRAQLKSSGLEGRAYLEMLVHLAGEPADREYFSKGLDVPLTGTSDWASFEVPFALPKNQPPDRIRLNLVVEGRGTVWVKDVVLLRGPLTK